jgi:steroid delta-isomerase-like uncharacterized protein
VTPQRMDELVDAHVGAEGSNDVAAAVAVYTDDIEHDVVGAPDGVLRGPDAAAHRYEQLLKELRQDELITTRRYHGDDFCVIEHQVTCTITGQFAGIPGNGRQVSFRMLHIFEFRDDAISRENVWMDSASAMAQLQT